jgi:hypothetical protein
VIGRNDENILYVRAMKKVSSVSRPKKLERRDGVGCREIDETVQAGGCDRSTLPPAAGHLGASQFTIHLTPNLSVTIPKASAQ